MFDSVKSRKIAYEYISSIENVKILSAKENGFWGFKSELEVWEIDTEILYDDKLLSIVLHVIFTNQFPLDLPKIHLSPDTFEKTKYIPHIDNNRLVCTFDTEVVSTNSDEPAGIVYACIRKSKNIILDGLSGSNQSDFNDEFKAYWEEKYEEEKYLPISILSLMDRIESEGSLKLICLKKSLRIYNYVLHNSDEISKRFKSFLKSYDIEYQEVDVYYLKDFPNILPPFELKNRDILNLVQSAGNESLKKFKAFLNKGEFPKLVVCEKYFGDKVYLFGWFHKYIDTNKKGFRPGYLDNFKAFSIFNANKNVDRITTDVFTKERLQNRTSGNIKKLEKSFLIAGVGSIGSNLVYFLNSMDTPELRLVDDDRIKLENIQRHLLGFEYVGDYKTKAIKDYLLKKNPLQKVSTKETSIVDIVTNNVNYFNYVDYAFIAIGNSNIDNWICESIKEGIIKKPVFIIWVEPYLCGGHCIFLHPSNPLANKYFDNGFFKFNVIDLIEYKSGNKNLSLREAGCQTTYIPYSGANVISFLSALFPYISSIIDTGISDSKSFSWIGNFEIINQMKIKISNHYNSVKVGQVIEHTI
jgi:hypothetical protein